MCRRASNIFHMQYAPFLPFAARVRDSLFITTTRVTSAIFLLRAHVANVIAGVTTSVRFDRPLSESASHVSRTLRLSPRKTTRHHLRCVRLRNQSTRAGVLFRSHHMHPTNYHHHRPPLNIYVLFSRCPTTHCYYCIVSAACACLANVLRLRRTTTPPYNRPFFVCFLSPFWCVCVCVRALGAIATKI